MFNFLQCVSAANLRPVKRWVAEVVTMARGDWLLDVCCGTGNFAPLVQGNYLGIDLDPRAIAWARHKFRRDPRKRFLVGDATALPFSAKTFGMTLFANGLHHLSESEAIATLRALARITRDTVIVVDPAPETRRFVSRLLLALDQGRYIRPLSAQVVLLEAAELHVDRHAQMHSGFASQRAFLCRPGER